MATERFVKTDRPRSLVVPLVALLAIVLVFGLVTPGIFDANEGATTPVRIALAVGLLAPISFAMGMPFVIGMRAATARGGDTPTAFLWGINGAASVCASVFAVVIAVFFGISAAFWTGAAIYAVAAISMWVISRALERAGVTEIDDELEMAPPPSAELV
jgi:cation transport ATPase